MPTAAGTQTAHETATSPAKQTTLGKLEPIMLAPDATEPDPLFTPKNPGAQPRHVHPTGATSGGPMACRCSAGLRPRTRLKAALSANELP